ncbi:hypothetical protein G8V07_11400 [Clostridium botulinum D/C]|nr:hypothetical protein [Clostridium botulinum]MCD3319491.1 hypothetical protein [Clostridium botulinum D/C]MCD3324356.1 hypothetical protein [Clostridium botulinum D/C]MCD3327357.1 hypothetical protein [Clostridium botulinum D/C]
MKLIKQQNDTKYKDKDLLYIGKRIFGAKNSDNRVDWGQYLEELIDNK